MDVFAIAGCVAIFVLLVVIAYHVFLSKKRPPLQCSVIIAEPMQPQVVCRSVPCQHPYYRVLSEYSCGDTSKESMTPSERYEKEKSKNSTKFDYIEWSRSLSLNSISRKTSHPGPSSRRSSTSDVGRAIALNAKSKPFIA